MVVFQVSNLQQWRHRRIGRQLGARAKLYACWQHFEVQTLSLGTDQRRMIRPGIQDAVISIVIVQECGIVLSPPSSLAVLRSSMSLLASPLRS